MQLRDMSKRIEQLIEHSENVLATKRPNNRGSDLVDSAVMAGLRAAVLSFIAMAYGKDHSYYSEFDSLTGLNYFSNAKKANAILLSIQEEINGGWIFSIKKLVAAEIFSDFLEMAEYLLEQGYKDAAAVMVGSVLEENLRHLCVINSIEVGVEKDDRVLPKKADRLNADLAKAEVYSKLDQKVVTAWLDLRNNAAHGNYNEYSNEQVGLMLHGVTEFLARMSR